MSDGTTFEGLTSDEEVGIRLPDGTIVWPPDTLQGHPLSTEDQRQAIVALLRQTATDLHIPPDQFLANYLWVIRKKITVTLTQLVAAQPLVVQAPATEPEMTDN